MAEFNKDIIVSSTEGVADVSGERLDQFVARITGRSRNLAIQLIEEGCVLVNGAQARKSARLKGGEKVSVVMPEEKQPDLTPQDVPFTVVLERDEFVVIDKPAGIVVHPAPGNYDNTLVNGLLHRFHILDDDHDFRPGIVHRLDKDTSGLLVVAKNRDAREKLSALFQSREVDKRYLAVCRGTPGFTYKHIEEPLGRSSTNRTKMCVRADGRYASSEVRVLEVFRNAFLAEVKINTGRTHQIRVHMSHIGHPLLGDETYGGTSVLKMGILRQALHSNKLCFNSPFSDEIIECESEIPEDIRNLLEKMRRALS